MKLKVISVFLLLSIILAGCQSANLDLSEDVTRIEVYEWGSEALVTIIEDEKFIDELITDLDSARTGSTANMDFLSPDFELHFNNDEQTLFTFGYYKKVMDLKVEGRYWDFSEDEMYNVTRRLPLEQPTK